MASFTMNDLAVKIAAACPGARLIRCGSWSDKTTWDVEYPAAATDEQRAAAQAVIDAAPVPLVMAHKSMTALEFYNRLTDEEVSALDASTDATVSAWRSRLPYCQTIEIDTEESLAMQVHLVSIGLFTSERIAEIFS